MNTGFSLYNDFKRLDYQEGYNMSKPEEMMVSRKPLISPFFVYLH